MDLMDSLKEAMSLAVYMGMCFMLLVAAFLASYYGVVKINELNPSCVVIDTVTK